MTSISLPSTFSGRIALSVDEAAAVLGVSRVSIYERIKEGGLASFKFGRRRLLRVSDVLAVLRHAQETLGVTCHPDAV